jgi:hypothetical protein
MAATRPRTARVVYVVTGITMAAFAIGYATAGVLIVIGNQTENASGGYTATSALTWWTQASVGLGIVPQTIPALLNMTAAHPTVLAAAGTTYLANTGVAGDIYHYVRFTEATNAPTSTEVEISLTISTGSAPVFATVTVFVETQSTVPTTAQSFLIAYDLGSAATTSIVLNSVQEISQQCTGIGTCP